MTSKKDNPDPPVMKMTGIRLSFYSFLYPENRKSLSAKDQRSADHIIYIIFP